MSPAPKKADALHDVRSHLALVRAAVAGQHGREQGEEGRAHADEQIGAHARGGAFGFALQTDEAAEEAGQEKSADGAVDDHDLLKPGEIEGLRELGDDRAHG